MPKTLVPGLTSKEARTALAAALLTAFDRWGLPPDKQATLLGVPDIAALRRGEPLPTDANVLARAGHLLAIDQALKKERTALRHYRSFLIAADEDRGGVSSIHEHDYGSGEKSGFLHRYSAPARMPAAAMMHFPGLPERNNHPGRLSAHKQKDG
ncbi:MAG TPA: antitoxin Xre-like helix-turn-helix domain-containing protein [Acidiferrobacterales bacterium]|nr:antitoxin Xre-like helix-turn-helix domain-containing protein [Acidiferrobacterales bacterium]